MGQIKIFGDQNYIEKIELNVQEKKEVGPSSELLELAKLQLCEYFRRERKIFDLPLMPKGTDFQRKVWRQLQQIPWGQVNSYGQVAAMIDSPLAARAVGMANSKNPLPIIIPCHRVIGAQGSLVGFAGGIELKSILLKIEGFPGV